MGAMPRSSAGRATRWGSGTRVSTLATEPGGIGAGPRSCNTLGECLGNAETSRCVVRDVRGGIGARGTWAESVGRCCCGSIAVAGSLVGAAEGAASDFFGGAAVRSSSPGIGASGNSAELLECCFSIVAVGAVTGGGAGGDWGADGVTDAGAAGGAGVGGSAAEGAGVVGGMGAGIAAGAGVGGSAGVAGGAGAGADDGSGSDFGTGGSGLSCGSAVGGAAVGGTRGTETGGGNVGGETGWGTPG